jgi:hypothetical protein
VANSSSRRLAPVFESRLRLPSIVDREKMSPRERLDRDIEEERERQQQEVRCPVCFYAYMPELPSEVHRHAEFHADNAIWRRKSKPEPRLAAFGGDVWVDAASPRWLHRIVYGYCVGMTYDPGLPEPQWNKNRPADMADNERGLHALVLVENESIPVGAVAFSQIISEDRALVWRMMFASIDDEWRRRGVMTRRWSGWREIYGDFTLETPLSLAMKAFVIKLEAAP